MTYEAFARLASGRASGDGEIPHDMFDLIKTGEIQHHILQALCRSGVREAHGDLCGQCHAYVIAGGGEATQSLLEQTFPGSQIIPWIPVKVKRRNWEARILDYIDQHFAYGDEPPLPFAKVRKDLDDLSASYFKWVRSHNSFKAQITEWGIHEWGRGKYPKCFVSDGLRGCPF